MSLYFVINNILIQNELSDMSKKDILDQVYLKKGDIFDERAVQESKKNINNLFSGILHYKSREIHRIQRFLDPTIILILYIITYYQKLLRRNLFSSSYLLKQVSFLSSFSS